MCASSDSRSECTSYFRPPQGNTACARCGGQAMSRPAAAAAAAGRGGGSNFLTPPPDLEAASFGLGHRPDHAAGLHGWQRRRAGRQGLRGLRSCQGRGPRGTVRSGQSLRIVPRQGSRAGCLPKPSLMGRMGIARWARHERRLGRRLVAGGLEMNALRLPSSPVGQHTGARSHQVTVWMPCAIACSAPALAGAVP